jgi:hypothetical protein
MKLFFLKLGPWSFLACPGYNSGISALLFPSHTHIWQINKFNISRHFSTPPEKEAYTSTYNFLDKIIRKQGLYAATLLYLSSFLGRMHAVLYELAKFGGPLKIGTKSAAAQHRAAQHAIRSITLRFMLTRISKY